MEHAGYLFKLPPLQPKKHATERGDLLDYFLGVLNPDRKKKGYAPLTHGFISHKLVGIPTVDLYALKSKMEDAARRAARNHRSVPPGAVFWSEIRAPRPESGVTLK